MVEKINWNVPVFGKEEEEYVLDVLRSGYVSEGPYTKKLEERLKKIVNAKHVILTTSATAALYLAIEADINIRQYGDGYEFGWECEEGMGNYILIPSLTFVATKNAAELAGILHIPEDVNEDYALGDPKSWREWKTIIPVSLMGRTQKLRPWVEELEKEGKTVIMDNAGSLGSIPLNGRVGCYSLQANKLINCGQGGFCATDDDEYAKWIRKLKDFGREHKDENNTFGFNFKFNDILAAVALGQLDRFEEKKALRLHQYKHYRENLEKYGKFMDFEEGELPLWIEFITDRRDELHDYLLSKGIETRKPWEPIKEHSEKHYPNAEYYYNNCLWLPNGDGLSEYHLGYVIKCIREFYE